MIKGKSTLTLCGQVNFRGWSFIPRFVPTGLIITIILAVLLILPLSSFSVPSYARQTNMACSACHTAFPQLTAFGRLFKLNTFKVNASLFLQKGCAFTLGYFTMNGDKDAGIYGPSSVDGSLNNQPNSNGIMAQVDLIPWQNTQFSLQYTYYNKFNGATKDYDGFGRNAADNNTLYLLVWINF